MDLVGNLQSCCILMISSFWSLLGGTVSLLGAGRSTWQARGGKSVAASRVVA